MMRRLMVTALAAVCALQVCGCFALLAGAAAGGGTAMWLSGKMTQEMGASFERTISAAEGALKSLKLAENKKTQDADVCQIMSTYTDGKTIWIDIHRTTPSSSKVEVRVGAVDTDKAAAEKILNEIRRRL